MFKKIASTIVALIFAVMFAGQAFAAVVAPISAPADATAYDYAKFKDAGITLNVYNWGLYISDGTDDSVNTVKEFEALTGIKVNYTTFANNEEMYTKIKSDAAQYDVIIPSDYMVGKMANEGMLMELDFANIPNFKNINASFKNPAYDAQNKFSAPYLWGYVGLIYNKTMVEGEIDSWGALWDEKYAGDILMFNNSRDAFTIALLLEGKSVNPKSVEDITAAAERLKKQKTVVQAYVMDEIFDKMGGGEAAVAPYYAGDALTMLEENTDLAFVVPKEGTSRFVDAMCIPAGSENKEAAEMFINYMLEAEVGKDTAEFVGYSTPNDAAYNLLSDDVKANKIAYPDSSFVDGTETMVVLSNELNVAMDEAWSDIRSFDEKSNKWLVPLLLVLMVVMTIFVIVSRNYRKKNANF